jgi:hypothetical protein
MDSTQLNTALSALPQGSAFPFAGGNITAAMRGPLYVPVSIPANVDLEFTGVRFDTDIQFEQRLNGRIFFGSSRF